MDTPFVDLLRFTPMSLQFPDPWVGHMPFAVYLVNSFRPVRFVELGTHSGNSYFAFCQAFREARMDVSAYSVDTWQGDSQTSFYSEDIFSCVSKHNAEYYAGFSTLLRMTFDAAVSGFSNGSIDLLHIDGCHTYEAVRHDFETWLPKLAPGAVVLLHDINVRLPGYGVWQFWEELQDQYLNTFSFFHSNGLGVLQLEDGSLEKKLAFFSFPSEKQQEFRDAFSALGAAHQYRYRQDQLQKEVDTLRRAIAEQNKFMAEKDGILAEQGQVLAEHERLFAYKDAVIAEQERVLAEREAAMACQGGVIAEKDAALLQKDNALAEKNTVIAEQESVLAEREAAMACQVDIIAEKDAALLQKDNALAEKDRLLAETHAVVVHLENTLHEIVTSRSWRLMSPLRAMISFLKKPVLK